MHQCPIIGLVSLVGGLVSVRERDQGQSQGQRTGGPIAEPRKIERKAGGGRLQAIDATG